MTPARLKLTITGLTALGIAAVAALLWPPPDAPEPVAAIDGEPVGLMTSLPIYWADGEDFAATIDGSAETPWVRSVIERRYEIVPLDSLAPGDNLLEGEESDPLASLDRMIIAQPRGLSPADNVALDEWVKGGGRLLMVLDPMLTGHYAGSLGDPRRPVATALIPPVVERWRLEIVFDDAQSIEPRTVSTDFGLLPVALGGEVRPLDAQSTLCDFAGEGVVATCAVGEGKVMLIADATLFELESSNGAAETVLSDLLEQAFE